MESEWTTSSRTVWFLFENGEPVVDEHGSPRWYATEEEALEVAANFNWASHRRWIYEGRHVSDADLGLYRKRFKQVEAQRDRKNLS